jgi:Protein of unknown function (DUF2946)
MIGIKGRKLISWIATLAILMSALAPSISQALSLSENGKGFVAEICSTGGAKLTQVIDDENSSSSSATMEGHCPYCVVSSLYLLPATIALEFYAPTRYVRQSLFSYQAPQPLFPWLSLPSRAPPVLY